jgi:heme/copper-type cytochrome/quinol oxidase subunit 1
MAREKLRAWCRWMPLWMLKVLIVVVLILIVFPAEMFGALRYILRDMRRGYKKFINDATGDDK